MHERALLRDLIREIESVAAVEGAARVSGLRVRLGALSHLTPEHFREHFDDAARGTIAEGAAVEVEALEDPFEARAQDVVLESVELELASERPRRVPGKGAARYV